MNYRHFILLILILFMVFSCYKKDVQENEIIIEKIEIESDLNLNIEPELIVEEIIPIIEEIEVEEEVENQDIVGRYVFQSINYIKPENVRNSRSILRGIDKVYFNIEDINEENYRFDYYDPDELIFHRHIINNFNYPNNNYIWMVRGEAEYDEEPFYRIDGELGGGGIYKHFIFIEGKIIIYYIDYLYQPPSDDDDEEERKLSHWYEVEIVFEKEAVQ